MELDVVVRLPQDVHKLCRTCMAVTENEVSHDILLIQEQSTTIAGEMFTSCFPFLVLPDDGLPKSICDQCASNLEIAYRFKTQCEQSESNLREILNLPDTPNTKKEDTVKKINSVPKQAGVTLYDSNLVQNYIEDVIEENKYELINGEFREMIEDSKVNSENESLQFDISKIICAQTQLETVENNIDNEDIFSLIEERKQCKSNQDELFIKPSNEQLNMVKQEMYSDEEVTGNTCKYCEMIFTNHEDLLEHQEECNVDQDHKSILEKLLKLENGTLEKVELFDDETNDNSPPYMCTICGCQFKSKYARNGHMSTHGPVTEFEKVKYEFHCDICNKIFYSESKLATHFYKHAIDIDQKHRDAAFSIPQDGHAEIERNDTFTCQICHEKCVDGIALREHIDRHDNQDTVICEVCHGEFTGETNLVNHLRSHGIHISLCKICHKRYDSITKLKEHMKTHLVNKIRNVFKCPICKSEFETVDNLKTHSVAHLGDFFECKKCKRNFSNRTAYENHEKQHKEPRFLCFLCGKQYFSSVTLQCHIRAHNNEKPFVCPHCKKGFSSRATLSVHKRIHSKLKPYVCSYCGYSCRQSGDLTMHIRTHTGDKPYKCSFPNCDRKFTTSSQRKEHYRRHTNERNHKCILCAKAFLESKTLKVHMLTHTGEKPHTCKICAKKFRRTHHLSNHMKGHRDNNIKM